MDDHWFTMPLSGIHASMSMLTVCSIADAQTIKCYWSSLIIAAGNDFAQRHTEEQSTNNYGSRAK